MLGWDITDYGMGNFDRIGFSLITIRNGYRAMADKYPKVYAEKLLYLKGSQYSPMHFHWFKTEDIINRGGSAVSQLLEVNEDIADLTDEDLAYIGRFAAIAASLPTEHSGGIPSIPPKAVVLERMKTL